MVMNLMFGGDEEDDEEEDDEEAERDDAILALRTWRALDFEDKSRRGTMKGGVESRCRGRIAFTPSS